MIMTEHPELGEAYDLAEPIIRAMAPRENNFECAADTPRTSEFYRGEDSRNLPVRPRRARSRKM
jgi:hypothetical protein